MKKKAQLSIVNVMNWFILVVICGVMTLIMSPMIVDFTASENNSLNKLVIYMVIPFLWLAVLITLLQYAQPYSPLRPF